MTANNKTEVLAYWATPEKNAVVAKLPGMQYQFASLEKLYDHANEAGWEDIIYPQSAELPAQAVSISVEEIDEAIADPEDGDDVDQESEAFSFLVAAKDHCRDGEYDLAIECALDAIELMRRLRVNEATNSCVDDRAGTARFGVQYENSVPKYFCLWFPDQKIVRFDTLSAVADLVKSEGLKVQPVGGYVPESIHDISEALGPVSRVHCPEKRIWEELQKALLG